jgi:hypothetical protein
LAMYTLSVKTFGRKVPCIVTSTSTLARRYLMTP